MSNGAYDLDSVVMEPTEKAEFVLLPEGEYPFTVLDVDTAKYNGGAKIPNCWKKVLKIEVDGGTLGKVQLMENIYLHSVCDWQIAGFFAAIGFRKSGDPFSVGWFDKVHGYTGRVKLGLREYVKKDGTPGKSNQVKAWLEKPGDATPPTILKANAAADVEPDADEPIPF